MQNSVLGSYESRICSAPTSRASTYRRAQGAGLKSRSACYGAGCASRHRSKGERSRLTRWALSPSDWRRGAAVTRSARNTTAYGSTSSATSSSTNTPSCHHPRLAGRLVYQPLPRVTTVLLRRHRFPVTDRQPAQLLRSRGRVISAATIFRTLRRRRADGSPAGGAASCRRATISGALRVRESQTRSL